MLNERNSGESTGHGSPLPALVHGGPGRAGGGEEIARVSSTGVGQSAARYDVLTLVAKKDGAV